MFAEFCKILLRGRTVVVQDYFLICNLTKFHADEEELLYLRDLPGLYYEHEERPATQKLMLHQGSKGCLDPSQMAAELLTEACYLITLKN